MILYKNAYGRTFWDPELKKPYSRPCPVCHGKRPTCGYCSGTGRVTHVGKIPRYVFSDCVIY